MEQLRTDLGAADVALSDELMEGIAGIRRANPQPM
jgi:aryl-alcohol dehydrogenase-like predicted oxidoreductase